MSSILLPQLFFVVGFVLGAAGSTVAILGLAFYVGSRVQARRDEKTEMGDPVDDLVALAVQVLTLLYRAHWDMPTVMYMARWLHEHGYTPLSDPEEVAAVRKEE